MIRGVVCLLRIFKMFHGLMNNPVFIYYCSLNTTGMSHLKTSVYLLHVTLVAPRISGKSVHPWLHIAHCMQYWYNPKNAHL